MLLNKMYFFSKKWYNIYNIPFKGEISMKKYGKVKYRKSIVKSMDDKFVKKYGFEDSYFRFERSINFMSKEGDLAEELALQYLKDNNLLSDNYQVNRVIALKTIKIEADIIDYGNKIIYETKSRKNGDVARKAIKQKWNVFEYDRAGSVYNDYEMNGIAVANYEQGPVVKGVVRFDRAKFNPERQDKAFKEHYDKVEHFKSLARSKGYDENGIRLKKNKKQSTTASKAHYKPNHHHQQSKNK